MTRLSVNLNKVALVRNARAGDHPGPDARPRLTDAAAAVVAGGAHGLTLHPRPDRRHALPEDAETLAAWLAEWGHTGVELNLEGNPFHGPAPDYPGFVELVEAVRPAQATLVPDAAAQLTSDHGWTAADADRLRPMVRRLTAAGCRVSLFVDPDRSAIDAAAAVGAHRVEVYTGPWAEAAAEAGTGHEVDETVGPEATDFLEASAALLDRYTDAARHAHALGLGVNAGHDLDLHNLGPFLQAVPHVDEVSIGQALVADALEQGLEATVRAYLGVMSGT